MRPTKRTLRRWRKNNPKKYRSYAEKRNRMEKHIQKEIDKYT